MAARAIRGPEARPPISANHLTHVNTPRPGRSR